MCGQAAKEDLRVEEENRKFRDRANQIDKIAAMFQAHLHLPAHAVAVIPLAVAGAARAVP